MPGAFERLKLPEEERQNLFMNEFCDFINAAQDKWHIHVDSVVMDNLGMNVEVTDMDEWRANKGKDYQAVENLEKEIFKNNICQGEDHQISPKN